MLAIIGVDCEVFNADYLNSKKGDHVYMHTVADGVDLASWWIKHLVANGLLSAKQQVLYNTTIALALPVITRWGSHYTSMKQLVRSERAINILALEEREKLINSVGKKKAPRELAARMLDLSANSTFWGNLKVVLNHLGPLLVSVRYQCNCMYAYTIAYSLASGSNKDQHRS